MKNLLFPICRSTSRLFLGGVAALSLVLAPALQAQTNFNFNTGNPAILPPNSAPYSGWEHWVPESYGAENPVTHEFTNATILPSVTFATNNTSAGNLGLFLHAGTTNSGGLTPPRVGSFFTNGPAIADFTIAAEFFGWTNGQGQEFGLASRVLLPLAPNNEPNVESSTNSDSPSSLILVYANARSAKNFNSAHPTGSSDNFRIYGVLPGNTQGRFSSESFSGPGANYIVGTSLSPTTPNGRYRLLFTGSGLKLTAQMVDVSTGLPMKFGGLVTNMMHGRAYYSNYNGFTATSYEYYLTNNGAIYTNGVLSSDTVSLGGASGLVAIPGSSGSSAPIPGNNTVGQPLDPKFDNFAVVPGVVTLESAAAVTGPFSQYTAAGIDLYNKRITIPISAASAQYYRIHWPGADHTPIITSLTPGPTVNEVLASGATTTVTNAVQTMVLTFN